MIVCAVARRICWIREFDKPYELDEQPHSDDIDDEIVTVRDNQRTEKDRE